jgi:tetratricopeptide (TPR) repeat protein
MTLIRVLGKTNKEKGDSFERLIKRVLDSAGYEDFRFDTYKTGREIDILAKHKVTGYPIICECKAHEKPISSGDINKFYSAYDREYQLDNRFAGLFFSLSGFISTAKASYEEMTPAVRNRFLLIDGDFVLSILTKAKIISSVETIDYILKTRTPYHYGEKQLVCINGEIYWEQLVLTENKTSHYIILGPQGEDIPAYQCVEVASKDKCLKNLEMLDINAMKKTLISLLDGTLKTVEDIAKNANQSVETSKLALRYLKAQNLVEERKASIYLLTKDLPTFINIAKQMMNTEDELTFYLSPYTQSMINNTLIEYFASRFKVNLKPKEKEAFVSLIALSPSAFKAALYESTQIYETTDNHLKELKNLPEAECNRIKAIIFQRFAGLMLRRLIADFENPKLKKAFEIRNIKGWKSNISITLATAQTQYLSISVGDVILFLPASGNIEAGQLLSATNFDLYIKTGDILAALGDLERAIKDYDQAIMHLTESDKLKVAWNNKGLSLRAIGKYDEAINSFDEALKIDPKLKEAWYNRGLALLSKGDKELARSAFREALEIDPEYTHARVELEKE